MSISVQLGYCIFRDNFLAELGMPAEELDRHAEEVLRRGQVLVLFPEGARQVGPEVAELLEEFAEQVYEARVRP